MMPVKKIVQVHVRKIRENALKNANLARNKQKKLIPGTPIIYEWWFKKSCLDRLFKQVKVKPYCGEIEMKDIDGEEYALLYVGLSKNGHNRLVNWHILDKSNFHKKGVENGRLSSLRQTLAALLGKNMTAAKKAVSDFMDENCIIEWQEYSIGELDEQEKSTIKENYLPLNYKHTTEQLTKEYRAAISELKRKHRK